MNWFHRRTAMGLTLGVMCAAAMGGRPASMSTPREARAPETKSARGSLGITAIKQVVNNSGYAVTLVNTENPDKEGNGGSVSAHRSLDVDMWIPWARTSSEFRTHHITIVVQDGTRIVRRFVVWQRAGVDGDFVRYGDTNPSDPTALGYSEPGRRIPGVPAVDGDRRLTVASNGDIALWGFP